MQTAEKYEITQNVFEALIEAMMNPGTVQEVPEQRPENAGSRVLLAVAKTVLDWESSFCMVGKDAEKLERVVQELTGEAETEGANDDADNLTSLLSAMREGPGRSNKGRTTIYVVEGLNDAAADDSCSFLLKGPGLSTVVGLSVGGLSAGSLEAIVNANRNYSPGEDTIFVDKTGRIACIPWAAAILDVAR